MNLEARDEKLDYAEVDPYNTEQIQEVLVCEREGFNTGLDPQELPPMLKFIATRGNIWLQYAIENGRRIPTGVMELIPLSRALGYRPESIGLGECDLSISPFNIIMENQKRVFADARRFAEDKDVIYHHGIAMVRRGGGYGTLLMRYALNNTPSVRKHLVVCLIDAAKINEESGKLQLAPNEDSFTVHLKAGFVMAGVVDPPVYDEELTYYSFVRTNKIKWASNAGLPPVYVDLASGSAEEVLGNVRKYTSRGFLGVAYSKERHVMKFELSKHARKT